MSAYSPFLALPAELRLQIYAHIFTASPTIDTKTEDGSTEKNIGGVRGEDKDSRPEGVYPAGELRILISSTITTQHTTHTGQPIHQANFTAILQTSRLINKEATPTLYNQLLFRICLGARGSESTCPLTGKLTLNPPLPTNIWPTFSNNSDHDLHPRRPLRDLTLLTRIQHLHLSLDFGAQVNPIWDALPVIRALSFTLPPPHTRKSTTATLRFGVATAITISRLLDGPWEKFLQQLGEIELGCRPDVEVDEDAGKWVQFRGKRFEEVRKAVGGGGGGGVAFVRFEERLGKGDEGLKGCCVT